MRKIILWVLAGVILLPVLLYGALHSPMVQTYLVGHLTSYLSQELDTEVRIGRVDVAPFRKVLLKEVLIKDRDGDVLVQVDRLEGDIVRLSLRHRQLILNKLTLDGAFLNIYALAGNGYYNYQFLLDYFAENGTTLERSWKSEVRSLQLVDVAFRHQHPQKDTQQSGFNPYNLHIEDLYLLAENILREDSLLHFDIDSFRYRELYGFELSHAEGRFVVGPELARVDGLTLKTSLSDIRGHINLSFKETTTLIPDLADVDIHLNLLPSTLDLRDVAHFVPVLNGVDEVIKMNGDFRVEGDDISGTMVALSVDNHSHFRGDFRLTGREEWPGPSVYCRVDVLNTSLTDISAMSLFRFPSVALPEWPDALMRAGRFFFMGEMEGDKKQLRAAGDLSTDSGRLSIDFHMQRAFHEDIVQYHGSFFTEDLELGYLLAQEQSFGVMDVDMSFFGEWGDPQDRSLSMEGRVTTFEALGNVYQQLALEANLKEEILHAYLVSPDTNLPMEISVVARLFEEIPHYDITAVVERANLSAMNIYRPDSLVEAMVSTSFSLNAHIGSFNEIDGALTIDEILYEELIPSSCDAPAAVVKSFAINDILLSNTIWAPDNSHYRLRSSIVDIDIHGELHPKHLGQDLGKFADAFLPALEAGSNWNSNETEQHLVFSFRFKNTDELSGLFFPSLQISPGSWINGSFDTRNEQLEISMESDLLTMAGRSFQDWRMNGERLNDSFLMRADSRRFLLSENLHVNNLEFKSIISNDSVSIKSMWADDEAGSMNKGRIEGIGYMYDSQLIEWEFLPSEAYLDGDIWRLNANNRMIIDSARVEIHNLMAFHENQYIRAEGVLGYDEDDLMVLSFGDFDLAYTDVFLGMRNLEFGGILDGYISFSGYNQELGIGTELQVKDFSFNTDLLGDLILKSIYDPKMQAFEVDGTIIYHGDTASNTPLKVVGHIHTGDTDQNFDLDIDLTNMKMSIWSRYMKGFANNFRGLGSGKVRMDGPFARPELTGHVSLLRTAMFIPFLNLTYTFAHEVEIASDAFIFDGLMINDTLGNTARASGAVMHNNFNDFALDVRINPDRMVIFNTSAENNSLYYGTGIMTGMAHIHGPVNDIVMDITGRTNRGTRVFLPLDYTGDIREAHFISFVERDPMEPGVSFYAGRRPGGVTLNFDLEITPEAEVQLLFDARFGDIITSRGSGDLKLEVTPEGAFNIYGDYSIEEGEYFFTLQNIINKRFRIEQGSSIRWTGDLNDATVDLRAAYRLRTPLYDLMLGEGVDMETAESFRRRVPVETVLILEDKLFNPAISFEIEVPGSDEYTREIIERVITTEQEMNRQVFSLLVLNRFLPTTADQYNTALGYGVGSTSSELLSNQLSNWLSQISTDFDIGVNYRPGDEISSQEVELALSTQLFDDRVTIDGNFGVAGNETATGRTTRAANQIIGDVQVEVKITPEGKFRVKAFNRSNTIDLLSTSAPYTQGIGLFYRREFDSFSELFRRNRRTEEVPELPSEDILR